MSRTGRGPAHNRTRLAAACLVSATAAWVLTACQPAPPAAPPPPPPETVELTITVPFQRIAEQKHNDKRRFVELHLEARSHRAGCLRREVSDRLSFEPRYRVKIPDGRVMDQLWVSGTMTIAVANEQACWGDWMLEDNYHLGGTYKWGNAPIPTTTTIEPPCWATTTTTTVGPTTTTTWRNAGDIPGLCSQPFKPPIEPTYPMGTSAIEVVK